MNKRLTEMKLNEKGKIVRLECGRTAMQRLLDLGLTPGTKITVCKKTFGKGPIGMMIRDSCIAIGHGLASKIVVETD